MTEEAIQPVISSGQTKKETATRTSAIKADFWARNFVDFLSTFPCKTPLFPNDYGHVITIYDTSTIGDAFHKMLDHRVMALPVIHSGTGKPLHVISMMHIMVYLVKNFDESDFKDDMWHKIQSMFSSSSSNFMNTKLSNLSSMKEYTLDPAFVVEENTPLLNAVQLMARTGTHRVLVIDQAGMVSNVITQSRIVEMLSTIVDNLPKNNMQLKDLNIGIFKEVTSVNRSQTAFEAFKIMKNKNLTGLPVVDDQGKLAGVISVNDLKLIGYNTKYWNFLGKSVQDYLRIIKENPRTNIRSKSLALLHEEAEAPAVKCYNWHTLGFVVRHIAYFGVHRIFVANDEGKPQGVITLTDILKELLDDENVQLEIAKLRK